MTTNTRVTDWFDRLEQIELPICLYFNRANHHSQLNSFFKRISRLGDGIFWYSCIALSFVLFGIQAWYPALHMLLTSGMGVLIYKFLKQRLVRERPFISHQRISCNTKPLDRYSFPSGHTLHALSFSIMLSYYYPSLSLLVFSFVLLVAMSRIILGLHYISDVVVGAFIGSVLAILSLQLYSSIF